MIRNPYTDTWRVRRCIIIIIIIIKVALLLEQISSTSLCATLLVCSDDVVYFQTQATLSECRVYPSWMGMTFWTAGQRIDPSSESTFVWRTDTDSGIVSVMTYTNWEQGQPNYYLGRPQACMNLVGGSSYRWNDQECHDEMCSVCKIDL